VWYVNAAEIIVIFNYRQFCIVISLKYMMFSSRIGCKTINACRTEKYATRCHFRFSPEPGRWTVTEYVCFVSPSGFEGLSFRLVGVGRTTVGSEALCALQHFVLVSSLLLTSRDAHHRPSCGFSISFLLRRLNLLLVEKVVSSHPAL
jgi:hypothetical protein